MRYCPFNSNWYVRHVEESGLGEPVTLPFIRQAYSYLLTPGICIMLLSLSFFFLSLYFEGRRDTISEG